MDHAYTMSGSSIMQTNSAEVDEEGDIDHDLEDVHENDPNIVYDANQEDDSMDDCAEDRTNHTYENVGDDVPDDYPIQTFSVLLPTEEWMQMLPPQYLLHYIRERTVFRDSGKASREGRESTAPLKRGWLQGAWRETLKEAIAKQTGIPCVINFNSSNFLKQPFSRKVGPPLWRVRACCRQDDGLCLKFNLRVQDFHPSKPQVEIVVEALGTLLEGQAGEERHTITASDHMKAIKSLQRFNASSSQNNSNGFVNCDMSVDDPTLEADDGEVQRLKLSVPTTDWISFLPSEAAEAYVLERSNVAKDRLALEGQEAWAKGLRHFVPRVTKECRQYLKRALAERTGLPCRIGLTGRCHLKPPFSRKKRAPLFVTNGFCGRKDLKCLRFRFTVQDFDPQAATVTVDVEIRGRLLTGPEGDDRHSRRPTDDPLSVPMRGTKRAAGAGDAAGRGKRQRRHSKKGSATDSDVAGEGPHAYAVGALQTEAWPEEFDLNAAEVILDEGKAGAGYAATDDAVNTIQVMSEVNGAESALGEDAARELVQLANEALSLAGGNAVDGSGQLTATKIVQSGDQVFIFVSDPNEPQDGQGATIEAVEVNCDELAAEHGGVRVAENESEEIVQTMDGNGSLAEFLLPNPEPEPQPEPEPDAPCMEYRWQLHLPMTDWLKLLPAKSLRYYIHERTVGREVWVEEGWERQFRSQTLQNGWRDMVRRAAVEQTDIPCQVCFRGRSSLKLPFSRKHAAALWRTQGYCARGDRNCLIYKFCVQDFHPDEETVTVQVYAVGKLHRDCRRWFRGEGTLVDMDSVTRDWPQGDVEGDGEAEDLDDQSQRRLLQIKQEPLDTAGDDWDDSHMMDDTELEQDRDDEEERVSTTQGATRQEARTTPLATTQVSRAPTAAKEAAKETVAATGDAVEAAGEEMYQAVLKSLVTFKTNLHAARRCPLKMQAALRLVRNADSMAAAPCKTPDCLCRPPQPVRSSCRPRLRWPDKPRPQPGAQAGAQAEPEHEQADERDAEMASPPPLQPSPERRPLSEPRSLVPTSPPPLRLCGTPTARPAAAETPPPARSPAKTTPGSPSKTPESLWQKVTRAGPVVLTAIKQQPSIIRLSPAQIAANARRGGTGTTPTLTAATATSTPGVLTPRSSSKLVSLSSAIVRSAVLTPSIIKPSVAVQPADTTPRRAAVPPTPRPAQPPTSQSVVSSSQDTDPLALDDGDLAAARDQGADQGADPSWIVDEMRSVILGGEQQGVALKQTTKTTMAPNQKPAEKTAVTLPVKTAVRPVVKTVVKPMVKTVVKPAVTTTAKPAERPAPKPAVALAVKPAPTSVVKPVAKTVERIIEKPVAKPAPKAPEKRVAMVAAKPASTVGEAVSTVSPVSPPRNTRIMVKKVGHSVTADDLPLVERALRSLERTSQEAVATAVSVSSAKPVQQKATTKTVYAPSRPVTRGVTKMVSASSTDPPPLVPIRKGPTANKPQAAATPSGPGRVSRVAVASTSKPADSPTPATAPDPQTPKVSTRADEARLVSSVKALFPKGKVLILKPSAAPILRSSPRRP